MQSKQSYKNTLQEILKLKSANASKLYERVQLLVAVFHDRDYRLDLGNVDDFKAADTLDVYLDDTPFGFLDLAAVLKHFPSRKEWTQTSLRELHAKACELSKPESPVRKSRPAATLKQVEELETAKKAAEGQVKFLQTQLQETRLTYDELLAENRDLRKQLHIAEGRIAELEKLLQRDFATA